jgi:hydrogenase maturation protease
VSARVLIAGVGNIFQGDDAFGMEVARRLATRALPEEFCVRDFGIRGFDLAYAMMDPWDLVIVIDAMQRGGLPGTLYVLEHIDEFKPASQLQPHGMDPISALELTKALGGAIPPTIVVACEPQELGGAEGVMGLSAAVEAAIAPAISIILERAEKISQRASLAQELNA